RVAPHVVPVEPSPGDPERGEWHGHVARLVFPVHEYRRPPPRGSLGDPEAVREVAADAPNSTAAGARAAARHAHGEDVLATPVEQLRLDDVPSERLGLARLPDLRAIQVRLVRVRDPPELETGAARRASARASPSIAGARRLGERGQLKPRAVPRDARVPPVSGVVPSGGDLNGFPRFLVELARAVRGVVARSEAPLPTDRIRVPGRRQRGRRLALDAAGRDGTARHTGDGQRALE